MKKIILILFTVFFAGVYTNISGQKMKTVDILTSAQCEMCKDRIESNMAFEKGIKDLNLDMETKKLSVTFKSSKNDTESIKNAIAKIGYDADEVKADPKAYSELPTCCKKKVDRGDVEHN